MLATLVPAANVFMSTSQVTVHWSSKVSADLQTPQKTASVCNINLFTHNSCKKREGCMTATGPRSPRLLVLSAEGIITF